MPGLYDYLMDQSFWGSFRNAGDRRSHLPTPEEIAANDGDSYYNYNGPVAGGSYDQALKAQQGQAIAGGVVSGLTGATSLLTNAYQSSQLRDTSMQEGIIDDLSRAGRYNYNNYDQLANDYNQIDFNPTFGYQAIRGMTTGQKIGSVGTSTLQGAATGLQIGGPWGALIGGAVGFGTGLGGVLYGDKDAKERLRTLSVDADIAANSARQNLGAANERIGSNIHRQNAVNAVAQGGPIRRQSIQDYAKKVLKRNRYQSNPKRDIIRKYGDGGLTIRIKK